MLCVVALFETAGKGSPGMLLADGAICKIWGVTGHRPNPPPINPSSSSYGLPPASVAATHNMRATGGLALSKRPVTLGLEVVVYGLCGVDFCVVGWVVGPPPKTNLVCLFLVTG